LFDNAWTFLKSTKFQSKYISSEKLLKISRFFWLLGLVFFLIYCVKTLRKTYTDESDLKVAALNKMTVGEMKQNLRIICDLRKDYQLNFLRAFSDFLICLNENDIPLSILGKRINLGAEGFFGMLSAFISVNGLVSKRTYT